MQHKNKPVSSAFGDKLKTAVSKSGGGALLNNNSKLTPNDGITHINIDSNGNTKLGQMLSMYARTYFVHPIYGPFLSMQGFFEWFRINEDERPDSLRKVHGHLAKKQAKDFTPRRNIPNFREEIVMATYYKIIQNKDLLKALQESVLPFKQYYRHGPMGIEIHTDDDSWFIDGVTAIRNHVKLFDTDIEYVYNGEPIVPEDYWEKRNAKDAVEEAAENETFSLSSEPIENIKPTEEVINKPEVNENQNILPLGTEPDPEVSVIN